MPYRDIETRRKHDRDRWKLPRRKAQDKKYRDAHKEEKVETTRLWRINNPERAQTWYSLWRGTSRYLLGKAKSRAKALGIEFSITIQDIPVPEFCPVLGIPLFPGIKVITDNSPTVDRIRLDRGYVSGNARVISYRANRLKSNATIQEIEQVLCYLRREQAC
jgi:hypothetical protein